MSPLEPGLNVQLLVSMSYLAIPCLTGCPSRHNFENTHLHLGHTELSLHLTHSLYLETQLQVLHVDLPLPYTQLQCSLSFVKTKRGLGNPNLLVACYVIGFILIYNKGKRNLINIISVLWCPSPILYILSRIKSPFLDLTASLRSRWNFWIVCLPSSAASFFLFVLLLNEIPHVVSQISETSYHFL